MPCYNVEKFIRRAIDSVIHQTYSDWELILINDGSTDSTSAICTYYAGRDSRIHYISQSNKGVAAVRNEGLLSASGEYIVFIDSDDVWPVYNLEYLLNLIEQYEGDIAAGEMVSFSSESTLYNMLLRDNENRARTMTEVNLLTGMDATECSLYQQGVIPSLSGKIYKSSIFDGLKFKGGELYEDLNIFHELTLRAARYVRGGATVYYYRQNPDSLLHNFNEDRLVVLDVTRRIEYYMRENHPELVNAATDRRFAANMNMLGMLLAYRGRVNIRNYEKRIEECRSYIREVKGEVLKNRKSRFKNRMGALMEMLLPDFASDFILKTFYSEK